MYFESGRINRLFVDCSRMCATQPVNRAITNRCIIRRHGCEFHCQLLRFRQGNLRRINFDVASDHAFRRRVCAQIHTYAKRFRCLSESRNALKYGMDTWIVADREHLGGSPRVRGTRISVSLILESLAANMSVPEIVDAYPSLTEEAVRGVLAELAHQQEPHPA